MHDTPANQPDFEDLFGIASAQWGYFTTRQANACGFSSALLSHHTRSGRFQRVWRSVYRLRDYPSAPREEVVAAWLAAGKDATVVSHESALELLGLSDLIPAAIHLTVPRQRRYVSAPPDTIVHTTSRPLAARDVVTREGVRMTSPARSIVDAAEWGSAPEQIVMAIRQAIDGAQATPDRLRELASARSRRVRDLIELGVEAAAA